MHQNCLLIEIYQGNFFSLVLSPNLMKFEHSMFRKKFYNFWSTPLEFTLTLFLSQKCTYFKLFLSKSHEIYTVCQEKNSAINLLLFIYLYYFSSRTGWRHATDPSEHLKTQKEKKKEKRFKKKIKKFKL